MIYNKENNDLKKKVYIFYCLHCFSSILQVNIKKNRKKQIDILIEKCESEENQINILKHTIEDKNAEINICKNENEVIVFIFYYLKMYKFIIFYHFLI